MNKKKVIFDPRALKDFNKAPREIQERFIDLIKVLEKDGRLIEPEAKKISNELFEIRVRIKNSWRIIYAYIFDDEIIILHIFSKQSNKMPINELLTAKTRLKNYI